MSNFNLLPPEEKTKIKTEKIRFSFLNLLNIIFFLLLMLLASFLSIYFYLNILVNNQQELIKDKSNSYTYDKFKKIDSQILALNSRIDKIYNIQEKFIHSAPILEEISNLFPEDGVYLTQLNITPKTEIILEEQPVESENKSTSDSKETVKNSANSDTEKKKGVKKIEKEVVEINVTGFAASREKVLEVESLLKSSSMFSEVFSPVENIIFPDNIDFVFTLKLKDSFSQ